MSVSDTINAPPRWGRYWVRAGMHTNSIPVEWNGSQSFPGNDERIQDKDVRKRYQKLKGFTNPIPAEFILQLFLLRWCSCSSYPERSLCSQIVFSQESSAVILVQPAIWNQSKSEQMSTKIGFFTPPPPKKKKIPPAIYDKVSANVMISVQKMGESGQMVF